MTIAAIPLSLYIHFPWCVQKCPYCDFNSHVASTIDQGKYIDALLADLEAEFPYIDNRAIETIFMGGGTPSLFEPEHMARLLGTLQNKLNFADAIEITLEANPGTVEQQRFKGYLDAGINRLSLGIQSFDDASLKRLGRIHDGHTARKAIDAAFEAGFNNVNLDLMHGLPEQTEKMALEDLSIAIGHAPTHLSWYQLTLEPNTVFGKYPPPLPHDDELAVIEERGIALLKQQGYHRYEISGYCRENKTCKHNLNYWRFGDYIGIGAGAHGKYTTPEGALRREKKKLPKAYLDSSTPFLAREQWVSPTDLPFEYMLNRLRLFSPILFKEIEMFFSIEKIRDKLIELEQRELITLTRDQFAVTNLGFRFLNDLMQAFFDTAA